MQNPLTAEQVVLDIAEAGKEKVTTVELTMGVYVNPNGVSKPSYYIRAWRSEATTPNPSASAYDLVYLKDKMLKALAEYSLPQTDKQRQIDELKAQIAKLESE